MIISIFDLQIPALISEGYSVLTWDMRGHGKSKPLGEKFNVRVAADDLIAILDRIEKLQQ